MKFWEAMKKVDSFKKVRREDWNRVHYVCKSPMLPDGDKDEMFTMIAIFMKDGRIGPYTPSNCDMLADDWVVL